MQISRPLGVTTSLLALLATVCIGSSTPSPAATATAAAKIKVRYGLPTAPPAITTVGVYYALDNGYFAEQGLDVEVITYPGSTTATRALLSGSADIVEASRVSLGIGRRFFTGDRSEATRLSSRGRTAHRSRSSVPPLPRGLTSWSPGRALRSSAS